MTREKIESGDIVLYQQSKYSDPIEVKVIMVTTDESALFVSYTPTGWFKKPWRDWIQAKDVVTK